MILLFLISAATLAFSGPITQIGNLYHSSSRKQYQGAETKFEKPTTSSFEPQVLFEETATHKRLLIPLSNNGKGSHVSLTSLKNQPNHMLLEASGEINDVYLELRKSRTTQRIAFPFAQQYGWQRLPVSLSTKNALDSISVEISFGPNGISRTKYTLTEIDRLLTKSPSRSISA